MLGVTKTPVWYILREKNCNGELGKLKWPGHKSKTTKGRPVHSDEIPLTTSTQVKHTLQKWVNPYLSLPKEKTSWGKIRGANH